MITLYAQGLPVQLRQFHDLSFIDDFGRLLRVFDQLPSGLLAFQMEKDGRRYMLKYAGAQTLQGMDEPGLVVQKLRAAAPWYEQLRHPALCGLRQARDYGSGFACLFDWVEGLPLAPLQENYLALRAASLIDRLRMMDTLIDLHVQAEKMGLIASGLHDSDLSFVPAQGRLVLLSIQDYLPLPAVNLRGRLPGSPRYLAPECYRRGASLDETTTVYALGALAFGLFGDRDTYKKAGWEAGSLLHAVAAQALIEDRNRRPQSAADFQQAWRQALMHSPLY